MVFRESEPRHCKVDFVGADISSGKVTNRVLSCLKGKGVLKARVIVVNSETVFESEVAVIEFIFRPFSIVTDSSEIT